VAVRSDVLASTETHKEGVLAAAREKTPHAHPSSEEIQLAERMVEAYRKAVAGGAVDGTPDEVKQRAEWAIAELARAEATVDSERGARAAAEQRATAADSELATLRADAETAHRELAAARSAADAEAQRAREAEEQLRDMTTQHREASQNDRPGDTAHASVQVARGGR
jgi:chromosome segregation ATPase